MSVHIHYYGELKELLETEQQDFILEREINCQQLWSHLLKTKPLLAEKENLLFDNLLVAINDEYVDKNTLVKDGDKIVFIPPVSGG